MPTGLKPNPSGVTLIEILLSLALLAVGIMGLLSAFPRGIAADKDLELGTIAQQLAQEKIETLTNLSYNEIATGLLENQVRASADPANPFYQFKRTTAVDWVDGNLASSGNETDLKKASVTVAWPGRWGGADRAVKIVTLITKK